VTDELVVVLSGLFLFTENWQHQTFANLCTWFIAFRRCVRKV